MVDAYKYVEEDKFYFLKTYEAVDLDKDGEYGKEGLVATFQEWLRSPLVKAGRDRAAKNEIKFFLYLHKGTRRIVFFPKHQPVDREHRGPNNEMTHRDFATHELDTQGENDYANHLDAGRVDILDPENPILWKGTQWAPVQNLDSDIRGLARADAAADLGFTFTDATYV